MPAERVAMRQAREIIRLKFSAGVPTREIARRLGVGAFDGARDVEASARAPGWAGRCRTA